MRIDEDNTARNARCTKFSFQKQHRSVSNSSTLFCSTWMTVCSVNLVHYETLTSSDRTFLTEEHFTSSEENSTPNKQTTCSFRSKAHTNVLETLRRSFWLCSCAVQTKQSHFSATYIQGVVELCQLHFWCWAENRIFVDSAQKETVKTRLRNTRLPVGVSCSLQTATATVHPLKFIIVRYKTSLKHKVLYKSVYNSI